MKKLTRATADKLPFGLPHLHAWQAIADWVTKFIGPSHELPHMSVEYDEHLSAMDFEELNKEVKHVAMAKAHDKSFKKMEISTVDGSASDKWWSAVHKKIVIKESGGKPKMGWAPEEDMGRRIQELIEAMTED